MMQIDTSIDLYVEPPVLYGTFDWDVFMMILVDSLTDWMTADTVAVFQKMLRNREVICFTINNTITINIKIFIRSWNLGLDDIHSDIPNLIINGGGGICEKACQRNYMESVDKNHYLFHN